MDNDAISMKSVLTKLNQKSMEPLYYHEGEDFFNGIEEAITIVEEEPVVAILPNKEPVTNNDWLNVMPVEKKAELLSRIPCEFCLAHVQCADPSIDGCYEAWLRWLVIEAERKGKT